MKLVPTFNSYKTGRNCKFCMFFWSMLIMFWSINSIADEMVHKYRCEIIFDDWQDLTEALKMINKFSPNGIIASAEHGGPIMPHFRNGKWHVTIAV